MVKRVVSWSVCVVVLLGLLAACGGKDAGKPSGEPTAQAGETQTNEAEAGGDEKPVTIKFFTGGPEYTDAYNAYIAEYKKVKPNVTIEQEVLQADYPTILKSKIAAGSLPDVFQSTVGETEQFAEYSADLTNEPLAAVMLDDVKQKVSYNGKVLGIRYFASLFGLVYNKDLFAEAGIAEVPKTTSELKDAIAKLEAKGITPFANGYKEWWVHKHVFQHFINGETDNAKQLVGDFIAGKTKFQDHPVLMNYFDFVDLTVQHGMSKPLERDFAAEVSDFASGKAAIMTGQGAWVEDSVLKINPDIKMGIMGYPVSEDPVKSMIINGTDQVLHINKDSKVLRETIDFFNWMYTSDYGKHWFADIARAIPPIKDGKMPNMQIPQSMVEVLKTSKSGDVAVAYSLDSFHQKFGEIMQAYIGKQKTKEQSIEEIEQTWPQLGAAK